MTRTEDDNEYELAMLITIAGEEFAVAIGRAMFDHYARGIPDWQLRCLDAPPSRGPNASIRQFAADIMGADEVTEED